MKYKRTKSFGYALKCERDEPTGCMHKLRNSLQIEVLQN